MKRPILLMAAAFRQGEGIAGINKFLHTVKDFSGAMGTYSASGKNAFTLPAAIKVVTESGFEELG